MDFTIIAFYIVAIAFTFIAALDFIMPLVIPFLPESNLVVPPSVWAIAFEDIEDELAVSILCAH